MRGYDSSRRYKWFEVWWDWSSEPPYLLVLLSDGSEQSFDVYDPIEKAINHTATSYKEARYWLAVDEYTRIDGRTGMDGFDWPSPLPTAVGLITSDVVVLAAWYEACLGFHTVQKVELPDGSITIFLERDRFDLEIVQPATAPVRIEGQAGFAKLVFEVRDLDALAADLKSRDVKVLVDVSPSGRYSTAKHMIILDPDGNSIELFDWNID